MCKYFWNAPLTGTDSKAGTLIHEISHFRDIGNTEDYGKENYGVDHSYNLAHGKEFYKALNHADSFEYYIEKVW